MGGEAGRVLYPAGNGPAGAKGTVELNVVRTTLKDLSIPDSIKDSIGYTRRVMEGLPRERFIPLHSEELMCLEYGKLPLQVRMKLQFETYKSVNLAEGGIPIGTAENTQKISSPEITALMVGALDLKPGMKVLEVGSGSCWSTAIIAASVGPEGSVIALELFPEILEIGKANLAKLGYKNIELVLSDGTKGWKENAPYDAILVGAASTDGIPAELFGQLRVGGKLVIPICDAFGSGQLVAVEKEGAFAASAQSVINLRISLLAGDGYEALSLSEVKNTLAENMGKPDFLIFTDRAGEVEAALTGKTGEK